MFDKPANLMQLSPPPPPFRGWRGLSPPEQQRRRSLYVLHGRPFLVLATGIKQAVKGFGAALKTHVHEASDKSA